jgi:hypothetical protein
MFANLIAAAAAEETALAPRPATVPDYGSDLSCASDLDPYMLELDGDDEALITQSLARRFTTPREGLVDDQDYGLDVRQFARKGATITDPVAIAAMMRAEAMKDDRVLEVQITIERNDDGSLSADVGGVAVASGPFHATMAITALDLELVQ